MSTYAALQASCAGETDHFLLHFRLSSYVSLPAVKSSNLVSTEIICVHANRITLQDSGHCVDDQLDEKGITLFSPASDWLRTLQS